MSSDLNPLLFFALFARMLGFFLLSPLFSRRHVPFLIRIGLALTCSLLLLPPLSAQTSPVTTHPLLIVGELIQEAAVGYLLGFLFSLLFEAAAFAGQIVGVMAGFSATELLDPLENSQKPLISRLFALTLFTLFIALDLHHPLLRLLYGSYSAFPLSMANGMVEASGRLFVHALSYALFPMLLLGCVITSFAIASRFFPALQVFWTGFPLQLLIGIGAIAFALGFFTQILQGAFQEFWALAKTLFTPS